MEKNEEIKEAVIEVRKLSQDEKLQREAELREKAIMDEKAIYQAGLDNGKEEGRAEGKKIGRAYNIPINVDTIEKGYPILCA